MPRKLKLFRTATGFHDAFVAAPSRKAALAAWGTGKDLFARGVAEEIDEPELLAHLSATPGKVFRRLRGDAAAQVEALGPALASPPPLPRKKSPGRRKPPKPDDGPMKDAARALRALESEQASERDALARREADLREQRRTLEREQAARMAAARAALSSAEETYAVALAEWRKAGGSG